MRGFMQQRQRPRPSPAVVEILFWEGETLKKMFFVVLMAAVLTVALVSCTEPNQAEENGLCSVVIGRFMAKLTVSGELPLTDDMYWTYTAVKKDSGNRTGEKTEWISLGKGLSGRSISGFSSGRWEFSFKGFLDSGRTQLVYLSEPMVYDLSLGTKQIYVNLEIALEGEGSLDSSGITPNAEGTTIVVDVRSIGKDPAVSKENIGTAPATLEAGVYEVKYRFLDDAGNHVSPTQICNVVIANGQTTKVSGSVNSYTVSLTVQSDDFLTQQGGSVLGETVQKNDDTVIYGMDGRVISAMVKNIHVGETYVIDGIPAVCIYKASTPQSWGQCIFASVNNLGNLTGEVPNHKTTAQRTTKTYEELKALGRIEEKTEKVTIEGVETDVVVDYTVLPCEVPSTDENYYELNYEGLSVFFGSMDYTSPNKKQFYFGVLKDDAGSVVPSGTSFDENRGIGRGAAATLEVLKRVKSETQANDSFESELEKTYNSDVKTALEQYASYVSECESIGVSAMSESKFCFMNGLRDPQTIRFRYEGIQTVAEALSDFYSQNSLYSKWFLPSYDEMSIIADGTTFDESKTLRNDTDLSWTMSLQSSNCDEYYTSSVQSDDVSNDMVYTIYSGYSGMKMRSSYVDSIESGFHLQCEPVKLFRYF